MHADIFVVSLKVNLLFLVIFVLCLEGRVGSLLRGDFTPENHLNQFKGLFSSVLGINQ